jgi:hypothetical protein
MTGTGSNPVVQSFDVTGLGATQAFGVAVGSVRVVLTQPVPLAAGLTYLFRADFAGDHPFSHSNADGGRWEVFAGGNSVGIGSLGGISGFQTLRQHVCFAFTVPSSGPTNIEFRVFRNYATSGVRNYVDNIELSSTTLPILCIHAARSIGTAVDMHVTGTSNALYFAFLSHTSLPPPGLMVPGIQGSLRVSPVLMILVAAGALDGAGAGRSRLPLPNDPSLVGIPLYFQGLEATTAAMSLGSLHTYPLIP